MPPIPIIEPDSLDCSQIVYSREQIYEHLPQRYEFAQLDGLIHVDCDKAIFAAVREVRPDEWWCRGHMPEQAIFPGVLMVESAAQLSAVAQKILLPEGTGIMGFGGIDKAKFRDSVYPPNQIILIGQVTDARLRKFTTTIQAFVNGRMAFEGEIIGLKLKLP